LSVILDFYNDAMHISGIDEGVGIQDIPPKPDINRIITNLDPPIGFGLFLIQALSDTVELNADSKVGHYLKIIIKKIPNELYPWGPLLLV
jgi:anti-sigma regulatory factor (Ser/Thr protein kinase)